MGLKRKTDGLDAGSALHAQACIGGAAGAVKRARCAGPQPHDGDRQGHGRPNATSAAAGVGDAAQRLGPSDLPRLGGSDERNAAATSSSGSDVAAKHSSGLGLQSRAADGPAPSTGVDGRTASAVSPQQVALRGSGWGAGLRSTEAGPSEPPLGHQGALKMVPGLHGVGGTWYRPKRGSQATPHETVGQDRPLPHSRSSCARV